MAQAIAEGLTLAEFDGGSYKTGEHDACARAGVDGRRRGRRGGRVAGGGGGRQRAGCWASAATSRASWPTSRATP